MRRLSLLATAAALGLVCPSAKAQDCSDWTNWDVRGTYTLVVSGWIDLSKDVNKSLPAGYSPTAGVQAFTWDGKGQGTGWISVNLGGIQFDAPVKWTYAVGADCKIQGTHSFNIGGVWTPPQKVAWVISKTADNGPVLELKGLKLGTGPGSEVTHATARRISMNISMND